MAFVTKHNKEFDTLETSLTGLIRAEDIVEIMGRNVDLALVNHCYSWINDFTNASYDLNSFEIYDFPKHLAEKAAKLGPDRFKIRRAIVASQIDENERFAEIVSSN